MLFDPARQGDLLANFCASRRRQLDLGKVSLDTEYTSPGGRRADIDKQQFILYEFCDFSLLLVLRLDSKQPTKEEKADFKL